MEDGWAKAGSLLAGLAVVLILSVAGFMAWKGEQNFKAKCVAVAGRALYDNDGDLECYRNGIEIAEHGKSTPK